MLGYAHLAARGSRGSIQNNEKRSLPVRHRLTGDTPIAAPSSITIIGASLAGLVAARTLRSQGFAGELLLIGSENEPPYDRPPLSKAYLKGEIDVHAIELGAPDDASLELSWRLGSYALDFDVEAREITLDDGSSWRVDGLIIATGGLARCPDSWKGSGVHVLRSRSDADGLRSELIPGARLVIVGAGLIGTEVASTARELGCEVVVVGDDPVPLARVLGTDLGAGLVKHYAERGIDLRLGVGVAGIARREGRLFGVEMADGAFIASDVVLVAIGSTPASGWLERSGIAVPGGVLCAHDGSTVVSGVVAVGDCALRASADGCTRRRDEHWTAAMRSAERGARALLDGPASSSEEPEVVDYIWSDQLGFELQIAGLLTGGSSIVELDPVGIAGPFGGEVGPGSLIGVLRERRLAGVLAVDQPRSFGRWRRRIGDEI